MQMIARSEAKHARSRQNLIKILRDHPNFGIELQAIAKRLKTDPAWLLNVMASESLFDPAARNGFPGKQHQACCNSSRARRGAWERPPRRSGG